jgi:hypothetical protein
MTRQRITRALLAVVTGAALTTASVALMTSTADAATCNASWAKKISQVRGGVKGGGPGPSSARVTFWNKHYASGVSDGATAVKNFNASKAGKRAKRSSYGTAPGGSVCMKAATMKGLYGVAKKHKIVVTEMAGASHSSTSLHYQGAAFDIGNVGGTPVSSLSASKIRSVAGICQRNGADEILHPLNDANHRDHIHCAWR